MFDQFGHLNINVIKEKMKKYSEFPIAVKRLSYRDR